MPPSDLVSALLADPVTRAGAVRHATLDDDTADALARDADPFVRKELAAHPGLPPRVRDVLADDPHPSVRVAVFGRADTPEPLRATLHAGLAALPDRLDPLPHVDSPYPCFRVSVAASESLPPDVVARLLDDPESDVRTTMAEHARHLVDLATAERVDREFRPAKKTLWRPADDVEFPPATLRRFATDPDPRMRCLAPRDPDLPAELAERLAADPDRSVRAAVAQHRTLTTEALTGLLSDDSAWVARAAGGSPYLPVSRMEWLLSLADL